MRGTGFYFQGLALPLAGGAPGLIEEETMKFRLKIPNRK
jgi:hypothetical protein